jgi:hypothetical protein
MYWKPFASLVLEAAYEATMLAGVLNKLRGASNVSYSHFSVEEPSANEAQWINAAIRRALTLTSRFGLDVRLVSYGPPPAEILQIAADFS